LRTKAEDRKKNFAHSTIGTKFLQWVFTINYCS